MKEKKTYCIDLHTHTISSGHAYSSLQEMITGAKAAGIEVLGMSDHAPGMPGSTHVYHFQNMRVIPKVIDGVRVLKGVEANIIDYNGNIDMSHDNLVNLDYAIASMHPPCIDSGTKKEHTRAIIKAMENPHVKIIGHPDDNRFPLDYEEVVKAAKENNVLLEINNSSLNPKGHRLHGKKNVLEVLKLCEKINHPVILGSDAHISLDVGNFCFCKAVLDEIEFPEELVVNNNYEKIQKYLGLL